LTTTICCAAFSLSAQNVTVINRFQGDSVGDIPEGYVLSDIKEQTVIINEYEPAFDTKEALLSQMISYGLKSFIDNHYTVTDGKIRVTSSALDFDENASAVVKNAIWINDLPFSELFDGFSDELLEQASMLADLNGKSLSESSSNEVLIGEKLSLYGFQRLVYGLKELAFAEALTFIDEYMPAEYDDPGDPPIVYLSSGEFEMMSNPSSEDALEELSLNPEIVPSVNSGSTKKRRRKNGFSDQVVELLEENNRILANYSEMFQSLQNQIDEINKRDYSDLREEMAEMRQMIADLRNNPVQSTSEDEIEYLVFDKNDYQLSSVQKARLNKTLVLLAKAPSQKVLVTGFADKSGDAEYNARLSRKRAESVQAFFESMGIDRERIVLTYFGDTESTTIGPADRRVEVSLID